MPKIYDNIDEKLEKGLEDYMTGAQRADFCVGYFNLRGWKIIAKSIDNLSGADVLEGGESVHRVCRLLVGMQKKPIEIVEEDMYDQDEENFITREKIRKAKMLMAEEFRYQLTIGLPTKDDEEALKNLRGQLQSGKLVVKLSASQLHAKLYLIYREGVIAANTGILGSSNLTMSGLKHQGELNIDVVDNDAALKLSKWFKDRWEDFTSVDITQELIRVLDTSWARKEHIPPYHIYLKIAYHLSAEARYGTTNFTLPTNLDNILFEYQKRAVQIAAHHIHKRGGVLIGDVVGLGKTLTAVAIAKIFENDFGYRTLILCPKNLKSMWQEQVYNYNMRAEVMSQSVAARELPRATRYKLIIIDESHNLRNPEGKTYKAIKSYIEEQESKVMLLTATPYNKTYVDLSSQLRLFLADDEDLGITPEQHIKKLGGMHLFQNSTDAFARSIRAFEKSTEPEDWQQLMRLFMIRRTRSFVKQYYAQKDKSGKYYLEINSKPTYFPVRKPITLTFPLDSKKKSDPYSKLYSDWVVEGINKLRLPRYGLGNYLMESYLKFLDQVKEKKTKLPDRTSEELKDIRKLEYYDYAVENKASFLEELKKLSKEGVPTAGEKEIIENLGKAGTRLMGFTRTNLFKRLESSGYAFLLSLVRHILKNHIFIYAIKNKLPLPISAVTPDDFDDMSARDDDDGEKETIIEELEQANFTTENHKKCEAEYYFSEEVEDYKKKAEEIYKQYQEISKTKPHRVKWISYKLFADSLLEDLEGDSNALLEIISMYGYQWNSNEDRKVEKLYETINEVKSKVLIFTQFADTAKYLYCALVLKGVVNIEWVSGADPDPTQKAKRFSPVSNKAKAKDADAPTPTPAPAPEIDVLIATDVLSEGQNLQDAHIIINFDLPWAIIRLIQRAGRVDRIGQQSSEIRCYSFMPEEGVEKVINLRSRLTGRIRENAEVVGSDEEFFDEKSAATLVDLYNEKAGILDDDDDAAQVDFGSIAYQIWKSAIDENPKLEATIKALPNVVYSTKKIDDQSEEGVVVYSQTAAGNDILAWVNTAGNIVTMSQYAILQAIACSPNSHPQTHFDTHHELVKDAMQHIKEHEASFSGSLGKKSSARFRIYERLSNLYKVKKQAAQRDLFSADEQFLAELARAIDLIYKNPLREQAKDSINRQLKIGASDHQLLELVFAHMNQATLVVEQKQDDKPKRAAIICSLGLRQS